MDNDVVVDFRPSDYVLFFVPYSVLNQKRELGG
jgi:hypothetical protein